MVRNEYRRALILLRALQSGLNGHVRLERRGMTGSLQCTVAGLDESAGAACAALAAKTEEGWRVVPIGELRRDARRQTGLRWTFDPRSIAGLPLERYQVVAVTQRQGGECRLLLFGFLNGSAELDARALEEALCASACADTRDGGEAPSAAEESVPSRVEAAEEGGPREDASTEAQRAAQEPPTEDCAPDDDIEAVAPNVGGGSPAVDAEDAEMDAAARSARGTDPVVDMEDLDMDTVAQNGPEAGPAADPDDAAMDAPSRGARSALAELGLDPARRWPESIEPLRALFASRSSFTPFAEEGYVFVRTVANGECPQCAVGVRAENGAPVAVAYAIPGDGAGEPPAGLEGYVRRDGWWVAFADAETGALLERE